VTRAVLRLVSWTPVEAAILAVDPGKASGAAVLGGRSLLRAWEGCATREQRYAVCAWAADEAEERGLPLVAVVESWNPHGKWGFDAIVGLAESAGRWLDAIESVSPAAIVRVESAEWRRALFGGGPNRKTEVWKALAQTLVEARFGATLAPNAAEAVCIGVWATHAQRVSEGLRLFAAAEARARKATAR